MNETRLCTIEQIEQFLGACTQIEFSKFGDDRERYEHFSRVLKHFDYPRRTKRERGILLRYLQLTSGYSRAQVTRLIARWHGNRLAHQHTLVQTLPCVCGSFCAQIHAYRYRSARKDGQSQRGCLRPGNSASLAARLPRLSEAEIYDDFAKIFRRYKALNRQAVGDYFFMETEDLVDKLCDDFEVTVRDAHE